MAVPALVERIEAEFVRFLTSRTGRFCQAFYLAELLAAPAEYAGPLRAPAEAAAETVAAALR